MLLAAHDGVRAGRLGPRLRPRRRAASRRALPQVVRLRRRVSVLPADVPPGARATSAASAGAPTIPTPRSTSRSGSPSSPRRASAARPTTSRTTSSSGRPTTRCISARSSSCPIPGSVGFNDADAAALRAYLLKGGFLWADDYWGPWAWEDFANEIGKVLPPAQYPIRELTFDHPIFRTMFTVTRIPQVPSWQFWSEQRRHLRDGQRQRATRTWPRSATRTAASWC